MRALPHVPGRPSTLPCPLGAPSTLGSQISSTTSPTEPRAPLWPPSPVHLNLPPLPEVGVLILQAPHAPHPCSWPPPLASIRVTSQRASSSQALIPRTMPTSDCGLRAEGRTETKRPARAQAEA